MPFGAEERERSAGAAAPEPGTAAMPAGAAAAPEEATPEEAKRQVRARVRAGRAALSEAQRSDAGRALTAQLVELVTARRARSVSCYLPVAGEPDTTGFVAWALGHGVEVLLPSSRADGQLDWIRANEAPTVPGAFGIPEPVGETLAPHTVSDVDLMLIPACAVDRRGVRLGWGRGFFDRSLGAMQLRPPVFAVVHDPEVLDELPREPHDVPVSGVVTPARVLLFEADRRTALR